jgi:hydrogenase maturation protease
VVTYPPDRIPCLGDRYARKERKRMSPILVIGIGNEYRGDDGVGLIVARALRAKNLPETLIIESRGDGAALMEAWEAASTVILIDAASSGAKLGTIYRFDATSQLLPMGFSFHSTHAFGVAEAIGLARALQQLPSCLIVYAIEGKNFSAGIGLSPEVAQAAQKVVEQVILEVGRFICA